MHFFKELDNKFCIMFALISMFFNITQVSFDVTRGIIQINIVFYVINALK